MRFAQRTILFAGEVNAVKIAVVILFIVSILLTLAGTGYYFYRSGAASSWYIFAPLALTLLFGMLRKGFKPKQKL